MAADALVVLHAAFVLFVVAGSALVWRWPRLAWLHVPAALWGAAVELFGWICPLTPLENELRADAGAKGYGGGFVEHYLLPVLYPDGLTRTTQLVLGGIVLSLNAAVYTALILRRRRASTSRLAPRPKAEGSGPTTHAPSISLSTSVIVGAPFIAPSRPTLTAAAALAKRSTRSAGQFCRYA